MTSRLQNRRDIASAWTSANPTLAAGEMGLETDTSKFKLGDGVTAWNSLAYAYTAGAAGAQGTTGTQGTTGLQGTQGVQGTEGLQGTTGSQGTEGLQGLTGAQGTTGTQGLTGTQGISGASILGTTNTWTGANDFTTSVTGLVLDATTTTSSRGVGYMGIPQSGAATTGAYTLVAADAGEHIYSTATRTVTIPANGSVAFPVGTTVVFIAATGTTVTIAITSDTLILAGTGTTGSRTLAAFGIATAVKITSTSWIISGNGLT